MATCAALSSRWRLRVGPGGARRKAGANPRPFTVRHPLAHRLDHARGLHAQRMGLSPAVKAPVARNRTYDDVQPGRPRAGCGFAAVRAPTTSRSRSLCRPFAADGRQFLYGPPGSSMSTVFAILASLYSRVRRRREVSRPATSLRGPVQPLSITAQLPVQLPRGSARARTTRGWIIFSNRRRHPLRRETWRPRHRGAGRATPFLTSTSCATLNARITSWLKKVRRSVGFWHTTTSSDSRNEQRIPYRPIIAHLAGLGAGPSDVVSGGENTCAPGRGRSERADRFPDVAQGRRDEMSHGPDT